MQCLQVNCGQCRRHTQHTSTSPSQIRDPWCANLAARPSSLAPPAGSPPSLDPPSDAPLNIAPPTGVPPDSTSCRHSPALWGEFSFLGGRIPLFFFGRSDTYYFKSTQEGELSFLFHFLKLESAYCSEFRSPSHFRSHSYTQPP